MTKVDLEIFGDRMIELFPRLARGLSRYENNYLTKGMLTFPQACALDYLLQQKKCQMRELAKFMRLGFSSTTGLVDRLVKQGLATRERAEKDRRAVYVTIAPKGQRIFRQIINQRRRAIINLFGTLTAKERAEYLNILEKLVGKLAENIN
jgi:DNA-binding MarR family transcriptional regulator